MMHTYVSVNTKWTNDVAPMPGKSEQAESITLFACAYLSPTLLCVGATSSVTRCYYLGKTTGQQ